MSVYLSVQARRQEGDAVRKHVAEVQMHPCSLLLGSCTSYADGGLSEEVHMVYCGVLYHLVAIFSCYITGIIQHQPSPCAGVCGCLLLVNRHTLRVV